MADTTRLYGAAAAEPPGTAGTAGANEPAEAAETTDVTEAAGVEVPAGTSGSGAPEPGADAVGGGAGTAGQDAHDGGSMFRNAYALMLSTGVSAALGLGFWLVAARYYSEQAVGEGSAAIAAMRLLASLTATTMIGAVVRYVPRAGRATGPLVWRAYLASSVVVCLASVAFLLTLDLWGPSYAPLNGPSAGLLFIAACVGWALLTLQDGVLTGLRKAFWVPLGNAVFSIGKLLLLVAFATLLPVLGIFVSWAAAMALSVLPLAWLIFRRLIPRQTEADQDRVPPPMREIGRFLAGDSVGSLFSLAMINLLPVVVAVQFDAAQNGFFYIAYTVGGTMEFMAINMASSLTAHASHSPETLAAGVRGALRRMTLLLVPVVLVLVVFAPQILAPFGPAYADNGTTVLRLLAAAALPRVVVELYIGVLRVQGRTGVLAVLQGSMCALVLGSAALLLGPAGIAGAGWAVLGSMTLVAAVCVPGLRAALTNGRTKLTNGRAELSNGRTGPSNGRMGLDRAPRTADTADTAGSDRCGTGAELAMPGALGAAVEPSHLGRSVRQPATGSGIPVPPPEGSPSGRRHGPEGDGEVGHGKLRDGEGRASGSGAGEDHDSGRDVEERAGEGGAGGRALDRAADRPTRTLAALRTALTDPARRRALLPLVVPLALAMALWAVSLATTDITRLSDYGLLTELPVVHWLALVTLTAGFWFCVRDPRRSGWWPLAYTVGLLLIERATQAIVYPTPLYSWAWKHDAVIDHLITAGRLQRGPELGDMAVYDQWPGFFAAQAALVELTGAEQAAAFMAWWPLFSSLLLLAPLLLIYRTFTQDRRLIWTAVWIFYVANWVGQDYFSPQSLAFALYLGVIAVALRRADRPPPGPRSRQLLWTALLVPLIAAIVIAHQLTPVMLGVSLAALWLTRRYRDWPLFVALLIVFLAWNLTASLPFLREAVPEMISSFGKVTDNLETGYGATPTGTGALVVSWAARLLSGLVLLLALIGVVRGGKPLRRRAGPLLLLAGVPLLMAVANDYGSEMIFRVLMFMLPFLCFFAASALLPAARPPGPVQDLAADPAGAGESRPARGFRHGVVPVVVLVVLTVLFVPSYAGKDRLSYFPPEEVALVQQLFDQAPEGSLVVAAHRNYPLAYASYWKIDHYWFLDDTKDHVDRILEDPDRIIARDMAAVVAPGKAYFLLTQGQIANSEMNGMLTGAQLRQIEESVAASPLFVRVGQNSAGAIYQLKPTDSSSGSGSSTGTTGTTTTGTTGTTNTNTGTSTGTGTGTGTDGPTATGGTS